jgi:protein-S-isoprenylcysteine O-methyltransferase Ste14
MFKLILFIFLSIGAILLSRSSLRDPRSHGFYRFFAFECIIALTLLNINTWLSDPFSVPHLLSWFLLFSSLIVVVAGFYALRKYGKPIGGVDQTTQLVTQGIYQFIRHPLYASLFLFAWGVFFKKPSLPAGFLALAASIFLFSTAKIEEKLTLEKFGDDYEEYKRQTKIIIPFIF